jgi:hypothetical protein
MAKALSASSNSWRRAIDLSWPDRLLLAEAFLRLGVVRLAILALPFRVIAARLGELQAETATHDDPSASDDVQRVRWAILAASRRAPWRCKCLEQGIAAKRMLHARRVESTLYLGVARGEGIEAHAWLRCGSVFVTGGDGSGRFAVVSTFGAKR